MNNLENLSHVFSGLDPWIGEVPQGNRVNFLGVLTSLDYFSDPSAHFDDVDRICAGSYGRGRASRSELATAEQTETTSQRRRQFAAPGRWQRALCGSRCPLTCDSRRKSRIDSAENSVLGFESTQCGFE